MKTVGEIAREWEASPQEAWGEFFAQYGQDERAGVQKLVQRYEKKKAALEKERIRIHAMTEFERAYLEYELICGVDVAGRGPLAGPVVAGAVILPRGLELLYVNDSKKLSESMREKLYQEINEKAVSVGVGIVGVEKIDEINILQATYEAMRLAVAHLDPQPDLLLNDAVTIPKIPYKQVPIIKGDAKSISIAAASIVAKVTRDRMMREYDEIFPEYGFGQNKGYGSASHMEAILKFGPCLLHRRSFLKSILTQAEENSGVRYEEREGSAGDQRE